MKKFRRKTGHFVRAGSLATLLLLGACDRAPGAGATGQSSVEQSKTALPPAIIPPAEDMDPPAPPSYEVGIATAAAERKHAKEKCAEMAKTERKACEEEADAAFAGAQAGLDDLRGNQQ